MTASAPTLDDIEAAHVRIKNEIRRTPCLRARYFRTPALEDAPLSLKLECLQVSGSFKARGASNKVKVLSAQEQARGLVTASGGNHGLGVAYAGWRAGIATHVYLPENTPRSKHDQLSRWGAKIHVAGELWDDAYAAAMAGAEESGYTFVHPFADRDVMAGQGTIGLEIMKQSSDVDTLLVSIGGGGLISGVATAVKSQKPDVKIIGIEPTGAPTLSASIQAGHVVKLERVTTEANTLAPRQSDPVNFEIIQKYVDEIVLVEDEDMRDAARWLWFEMSLGVELSGAAAVAALRTRAYVPDKDENVCAIVCGAGTDGFS